MLPTQPVSRGPPRSPPAPGCGLPALGPAVRCGAGGGAGGGRVSAAPRLLPQRGRPCRNNDPPSPRQPGAGGGLRLRAVVVRGGEFASGKWGLGGGGGRGGKKINHLEKRHRKKFGIAGFAGAAAFDRGQRRYASSPCCRLVNSWRVPGGAGISPGQTARGGYSGGRPAPRRVQGRAGLFSRLGACRWRVNLG